MKILFFFFLALFSPIVTNAGSIEELEILNGIISREFESNNNVYSVILNDTETELKISYKLNDEKSTVNIINNTYQDDVENKTIVEVTNQDGSKEEYVFYLEKEQTEAVFSSYDDSTKNLPRKEIPHLKEYVIGGCTFIILILFKIIVLGFKKKH